MISFHRFYKRKVVTFAFVRCLSTTRAKATVTEVRNILSDEEGNIDRSKGSKERIHPDGRLQEQTDKAVV